MKHTINKVIVVFLLVLLLVGCSAGKANKGNDMSIEDENNIIENLTTQTLEMNTESSIEQTKKVIEEITSKEEITLKEESVVAEKSSNSNDKEIFKYHGYSIDIDESDEFTVDYRQSWVDIRYTDDIFFSISGYVVPSFVDINVAVKSENYSAWALNLTDGELYDNYAIDEITNCNIYSFEQRIPMGAYESGTVNPKHGYVVVFSSPESDTVFNMFCPYEWDVQKVYDFIDKIDIHYNK